MSLYGEELVLPRCWDCQAVWVAAEDARDLERRREVMLRQAGLVGRLAGYTLDSYRATVGDTLQLRRALVWMGQEERRNLILHGSIGTGKTGLAAALVRELCERELARDPEAGTTSAPGLLVVWRDLLAEARAAITTDERGPWMLLERARRVPVLVLDDLGAERPTDWAREELATLVQARYDHGRPVVVTTNYQGDDLARRLGHDDPVVGLRILSRLLERADTTEFTGPDLRRR